MENTPYLEAKFYCPSKIQRKGINHSTSSKMGLSLEAKGERFKSQRQNRL